MKLQHKLLCMLLAVCGYTCGLRAQQIAVKSNVLSDAMANISLGVEAGVAPRWSIELTGSFNGWSFSEGKRWKHWLAMPEARYWLCDVWDGHFFGVHLIGGQYNIGHIGGLPDFLGTEFSTLRDFRYQGWAGGAGIAYGYSWILNRHWNIEAEIGLGWVYTRFDKFRCSGCGKKLEEDRVHNYVGPTKAAINIIYAF